MLKGNFSLCITAYSCFCLLFIGFAFILPLYARGEETAPSPTPRFNNENWNTVLHPLVKTFEMLPDGSFEGETVTGIHFTQYTIMEKGGIRVQRFEMQDHYHFIVQGEIAYSKSELSMLLAKYLITSPDSV